MKAKIGLTDEVVDFIADKGFLKSFIGYASEQTDSPKKFLLISGLTALASAIGNKAWIRVWGQRIFPNLWCLLVAPSGIFRKNTAIDFALNLLRQATKGRIAPADFSREAWLDSLKTNPAQIIVSKEFGELLTKLSRDFMAGTKETLTDFFTSTPVYERATKGGGLVRIEYPCISLIGGSSLIWLQERLKSSDFGGGFLARFLLSTATEKERWLGIRQFKDPIIEEELVKYLRELDELEIGEMSLEEIEGEFNLWLSEHEKKMTDSKVPPELEGFVARIGSYCLKLSLLFELSNEPKSHSISPNSFDKAKEMLKYQDEELRTLIDTGLTLDKTGRDLEKLKSFIHSNNGIKRSDGLRYMKCDAAYFNRLVETLHQRQDIESRSVGTRGRTKVMLLPKDDGETSFPKPAGKEVQKGGFFE